MRLSVLAVAAGSILLIGFAALERQLSTAENAAAGSSALDITRSTTITGGETLALVIPFVLSIAAVLGIITVSLGGFSGGVGR